MEKTVGILNKIKHHEKLNLMVNENCKIALPDDILKILMQPHKLSFYYFVFVVRGTSTYKVDMEDVTISDGQLLFGLPNQIFDNSPKKENDQYYKISLDEQTLALLPHAYPFLLNPLNSNIIHFDDASRHRVKLILSILFKLLHTPGRKKHADIILANLNTLLTEFNNAYFEHHHQEPIISNPKLSKYVAFQLAVENHLTEQYSVNTIAEELALTTNSLYGVVKEFSGLSPKEWMTKRLMLEAQRKLQYATHSVKEVAYELGYNDPSYFSRIFKKSTGKSIRKYLEEIQDLSSK